MTLYELSFTYEQSAELLHGRILELRQAEKRTTDSEERYLIRKRLSALNPMLREMREMTMLSRHYYERSDQKNEKHPL